MKGKLFLILVFSFALLVIGGFVLIGNKALRGGVQQNQPTSEKTSTPQGVEVFSDTYSQKIIVGDQELFVDIADTDAKRIQGLSGRTALGKNQGMLLVFETPGRYGIWMKDMKFSIDVVWADEHLRVVDIRQNVSPESFPEIFYPASAATYIVEVSAGWAGKNRIERGAIVRLE